MHHLSIINNSRNYKVKNTNKNHCYRQVVKIFIIYIDPLEPCFQQGFCGFPGTLSGITQNIAGKPGTFIVRMANVLPLAYR